MVIFSGGLCPLTVSKKRCFWFATLIVASLVEPGLDGCAGSSTYTRFETENMLSVPYAQPPTLNIFGTASGNYSND